MGFIDNTYTNPQAQGQSRPGFSESSPVNFQGGALTQSLQTPKPKFMDADLSGGFGGGQNAPPAFQAAEIGGLNSPGAGPQLPGVGGPPDMLGQWTKGVGLAADVAGIGFGVANALQTSKQNKFMRGYYENKMDMDKENFRSNARSYNESLAWREKVRSSAAGNAEGSDAMNKRVEDSNAKYGASETFA
jgi:hypothetical protein